MLPLFSDHFSHLTTLKSRKPSYKQDSNSEETIFADICVPLQSYAKYYGYIVWLYVCLKHLYKQSIHWLVEILYNEFILFVNELKYLILTLSHRLRSEILFGIKFSGIKFCNFSVERALNQLLVSKMRKWIIFEVKKFAFNYNFTSIEFLQVY